MNPNRPIELAAIRAVTALFEDHSHIVGQIAGVNDHGEDLFVRFVEDLQTTGHTIAIQVKGGKTTRASGGYRVRVENHAVDWSNPTVPVICVVQDPDSKLLYWANATEQLKKDKGGRSIFVPWSAQLDGGTIAEFVTRTGRYLNERSGVRQALAELSGAKLDSADYLGYFMNTHGEHLIFRQPWRSATAELLHSDLGWEPTPLGIDMVDPATRAERLGISTIAELGTKLGLPDPSEAFAKLGVTSAVDFFERFVHVGGVILDVQERAWLKNCFAASAWWREDPTLLDRG
ncbi:DUF4365 domain-containing protein [Kribbella sp. CA-293567]|uniref:DUF4365 domain-containing protein n=1 Tax=Kribbella sp. CA-293567 TaxID=3002436 RepID=UPI0022DE07B8|nr:DUF4365 domain-containing protein [Kribbella sp. CA-293567]WBQ02533.1 DUF4365 domain-containing protein [Kribbella sp. CA-293567]